MIFTSMFQLACKKEVPFATILIGEDWRMSHMFDCFLLFQLNYTDKRRVNKIEGATLYSNSYNFLLLFFHN